MKGILAIHKINEISNFLATTEGIKNYKIVLQLAMRIEVIILVDQIKGKNWYLSQKPFEDLKKAVLITEIEFDEDEDSQKQYDLIFTTKIDLGLRRRLSNLIEPTKQEIKKPCPVVTFYSYKGGVGRTTTLAFFASWLAIHHDKKVVILDCDFEAPGFSNSNYFKIERNGRNGVVEYLLNREYTKLLGQELNIEKDYAYTAGSEFEGKGKIYVIPAGNLGIEETKDDNEIPYNHRKDYLEGLARLDLTGTNHILKQFEEFFEDLKVQLDLSFENSVILIDSRTGFNDTFSVLATLSNIIVGIFGDNEQNKVGLYEFLDSFGELGKNKEIVLANTFSFQNHNDSLKDFEQIVKDYVSNPRFEDDEMGKKISENNIKKLEYSPYLANWGTNRENVDHVKRVINSNSLLDITDLCTAIYDKIDAAKNYYLEANMGEQEIEVILASPIVDSENISVLLDNSKDKVNAVQERDLLLRKLSEKIQPKDNYPNEIPKIEDFFFRDCMKEVFKRDKFLIIGYKGTGKTMFYLSFKSPQITRELCTIYQEKVEKYVFVNVIPVHKPENKSAYVDTKANFRDDKINEVGKEYFYRSFWLLYAWNSIFSDQRIQHFQTKPSNFTFDFLGINASVIQNWILDDKKMEQVNQDLQKLDTEFSEKGKVLILAFDQIDFVVAPNYWSDGVAPLINYWRINPFNAIHPKIFLRSDVYENKRLGNITNIKEVENYSVNLAWSKEELFSYWFKIVFDTDKKTFYKLCYKYNDYSAKNRDMIMNIDSMLNKTNQIPVNKNTEIRFLVNNFFGRYANRYNTGENFGLSYDWFYNNLADAKGMISIRPLRDLMSEAIKIALRNSELAKERKESYNSKQVLAASLYSHREATTFYSKAYFEDLAGGDNDNLSLTVFYDYVTRVANSYEKVYEFTSQGFHNLLSQVINKNKQDSRLTVKTVDELRVLLVSNGIFKVEKIGNQEKYIMPFLYRNYFGVSKPTYKTLSPK